MQHQNFFLTLLFWCDLTRAFCLYAYETRSTKPRNRPAFRQIQMHLEIATPDWLNIPNDDFFQLQVA